MLKDRETDLLISDIEYYLNQPPLWRDQLMQQRLTPPTPNRVINYLKNNLDFIGVSIISCAAGFFIASILSGGMNKPSITAAPIGRDISAPTSN